MQQTIEPQAQTTKLVDRSEFATYQVIFGRVVVNTPTVETVSPEHDEVS